MRLRMVRPNNQQTQELVGDYVQATMTEGMDDAIPSPRSIMVGFVGTSGHSADPVGVLGLGREVTLARVLGLAEPYTYCKYTVPLVSCRRCYTAKILCFLRNR